MKERKRKSQQSVSLLTVSWIWFQKGRGSKFPSLNTQFNFWNPHPFSSHKLDCWGHKDHNLVEHFFTFIQHLLVYICNFIFLFCQNDVVTLWVDQQMWNWSLVRLYFYNLTSNPKTGESNNFSSSIKKYFWEVKASIISLKRTFWRPDSFSYGLRSKIKFTSWMSDVRCLALLIPRVHVQDQVWGSLSTGLSNPDKLSPPHLHHHLQPAVQLKICFMLGRKQLFSVRVIFL